MEPFTFLHLALLVVTLAGLAVLWRLVGRFVDQPADDQLITPPTPSTFGLGHDDRMFTIIYPRTVDDPTVIALRSLSETVIKTSGAYYSTRLGIPTLLREH
jgi:hypothetical protein